MAAGFTLHADLYFHRRCLCWLHRWWYESDSNSSDPEAGFKGSPTPDSPQRHHSIKLGNTLVADKVLESVWGFFAMYALVFLVLLLAMLATDMDVVTAFRAVGASINNLDPGLEGVAKNYSLVSDTGKWILCFAMLLGRLEIFTLLVLFLPMFWRR